MEVATVGASAIVLEHLNEDNYERWSVWVKTYLLANELWDISQVPEGEPGYNVWRRKNAQALHAIQISCGLQTFSLISHVTTSQDAWNILDAKLRKSSSASQKFMYDPGFEFNENNCLEFEPFFDAVRRGKWEEVRIILREHPDAIRARVPYSGKTALHIATNAGHTDIVEQLVQLMPTEYLEIRGDDGMTALAAAANKGFTRIVKCMVWKNKKILRIGDASNRIPVVIAYRSGYVDMTRYLYSLTPLSSLMPDTGPNGPTIVSQCFIDKKYDIAWDLIQRFPRLAISRDHYGVTPLYALSGVSSAFKSGMQLNFLEQWIFDRIKIQPAPLVGNDIHINVADENDERYSKRFLLRIAGINRLHEMKLIHIQSLQFLDLMCDMILHLDRTEMQNACVYEAIFQAVERGIPEFLTRILKAKPELVWITNEKKRSLFHYAIECRQEKIYSLIYGLRMKDAFATLVDTSNNNMLHMAAMPSPFGQLNHITGAALKMQRELQWYKEVETIVPPQYLENTNQIDYKRPHDLFTMHHRKLMVDGEKWMKDTASSCSVVGALIVTIMFAAAFTVPGGNNGITGFPIFINEKLFRLFIISDAVSLFSSTTSSLMFLEILTSRYAEEDFLVSLPRKILTGLSALFLSIATMVLAFCASLLIMLQGRPWTVFPVISLSIVPVSLFACMKFPLFVEIFNYTYGSKLFNRNVEPWL